MRMAMQKSMNRIATALMAAGLFGAPSASAQDSLAGKNVTLIIGFGAGGGYDLWGRLVARHIGKHLPGTPTVATSLRAIFTGPPQKTARCSRSSRATRRWGP
jgi:hypothetical protein